MAAVALESRPHPITLRFPPALEGAFRVERARRSQRLVHAFDVVAIVAFLGYDAAQLLLDVHDPPALALLRRALVAVYAVHLALTFGGRNALHWPVLGAAAALFVLYVALGPPLLAAGDPGRVDQILVVNLAATIAAAGVAFTVGRLGFLPAAAVALATGGVWLVTAFVYGGFTRGSFLLYALMLVIALATAALSGYLVEYYMRLDFLHDQALERERAKSEALLLNVLPPSIAARLKDGDATVADNFECATVLFADLVGFTQLSLRLQAAELVALLNEVFCEFDAIAARRGLEKIKTIGDAYMLVGGVPTPCADHAHHVAAAALELRDVVARFALPSANGDASDHPLAVRIGMHTGPVVAGVIGTSKFAYDLWGDTVNTAARMESHGLPGEIQLTPETAERLRPRYVVTPRGEMDVKGKGPMETYLLVGPIGRTPS